MKPLKSGRNNRDRSAAEKQSSSEDQRDEIGCGRLRSSSDSEMPAAEPTAFLSSSHGNGSRLRIICFGAHPDDCEIKAGGVAAMWAEAGHYVKLVSVTNGALGYWRETGENLVQRRKTEVEQAARILGVTTEVLDINDGELLPTIENRRLLTRLIREWQADIVLGPRPNDYHPDHRYAGALVQDAAFMVTVPLFCHEVPHLKRNPVFFYYADLFQKPNPFQPDIVISIDRVIEKKLDALDAMESQFYEGGASGYSGLIPKDRVKQRERRRQLRAAFAERYVELARRFRSKLVEFYGTKQGTSIRYAEAYEVCEYGRRPDTAELKELFPFFAACGQGLKKTPARISFSKRQRRTLKN